MKKLLISASALLAALTLSAQGGNTGYGDEDPGYASLAERVLHLEKRSDAFNFYFNYAASYQLGNETDAPWSSAFRAKYLRLEIKGHLGDHLFYRLRHRLNNSMARSDWDAFSKATDIMTVGWQFNDRWSLSGGKICQSYGGFEYEENPLYIYEYSELLNHMEIFFGGVSLNWTPVPGQEFVLNVTNAYNERFDTEYAGLTNLVGETLEAANHPFTYIFNWNGNFLDGRLSTRWGAGHTNQAKDYSSKLLFLGQKLSLPSFQCYFDYMGVWEGLDRFRIASNELAVGRYCTDVQYNSFVLKANWQFAPGFNLMAKGMFETARTPEEGTYRQNVGYIGSLEYYPAADQDFRIFLAYVGKDFHYKSTVGIPDRHVNRIELGFMYRIKAY